MRIRKLSSLSLSLVSVLAVAAGLGLGIGAGCSEAGGPAPEPGPQTSITQLPLSAACSSCAQDALATTCAGELAACDASPSCFDVEACLVACPPQDVACFSACAQASAQFNELTSCVFCATCPAECDGEWQCSGSQGGTGGGPATSCDQSGDCGSCASCAITSSDCGPQMSQCQANPECFSIVQCVSGCGVNADCVQGCAAESPGGAADFEPLATCVMCDACPSDCSAEAWDCGGGSSGSSGSGGGSDCASCVLSISVNQCAAEFEACATDAACTEIVACVEQCGVNVDCAQQCAAQHPAGLAAFEPLAACSVCDACPMECDGQAWGCP
jgi:hypothetical protein